MKEKEILVDSKNPLYANSTLFAEEESEYNPIPHTAATTLTIAANKVKRWHPFVNGITETPLPMQWEAFTLEWYDKDTNLDEHIFVYITLVSLYST